MLRGIEPSYLEEDSEPHKSRLALWVLNRCRSELPLQPPALPPVVEGGLTNPQFLGNLRHALPIGRAHPFLQVCLYSESVSKN